MSETYRPVCILEENEHDPGDFKLQMPVGLTAAHYACIAAAIVHGMKKLGVTLDMIADALDIARTTEDARPCPMPKVTDDIPEHN